jgi:hypothetical protein
MAHIARFPSLSRALCYDMLWRPTISGNRSVAMRLAGDTAGDAS